MSKLNVFDAINKLVGNTVKIYTGPIHKKYADDFELMRGRPVCKKKDVIVKRHGNFCLSEDGSDYISLEYGRVLLTYDKAMKQCDDVVKKNSSKIIGALSGRITNPKDQHRILDEVKMESESLYIIPSEIKYSHDISKKDYKQFVKKYDNKDNKKK